MKRKLSTLCVLGKDDEDRTGGKKIRGTGSYEHEQKKMKENHQLPEGACASMMLQIFIAMDFLCGCF